MSTTQTLAWGAIGSMIYLALQLPAVIIRALRGRVVVRWSVERLAWLAVFVATSCLAGAVASFLVIGGTKEYKPLVAVFIGLASIALVASFAVDGRDVQPKLDNADRPSSSPPPMSALSVARGRKDAAQQYLKSFTSGRVTAAATVVMAVVAVLAYITQK